MEKPRYDALLTPVKDLRPASNEGPGFLRFVPLVLYTTEEDQLFDQVLLENGTRFGAVPDPETGFSMTDDLHEAIKKQIAWSGPYGAIFDNKYEAGEWSENPKPLHEISVSVKELSLQRKHLRYGFGPLAFIPHAFGAPDYLLRIQGEISVEVNNSEMPNPYYKTIIISDTHSNSWYQSIQAEQRALDHLGITLRSGIEELTNHQ